jgi:gluconolactonase
VKTLLQFAGLLALSFAAGAQGADTPLASINLMSASEAALVHATWRYGDARVAATRFLAPGANGQPGTSPIDTQIIEPRAGRADFDDSAWPVITAESLSERRGAGRVSFNWYRLSLTLPDEINGVSVAGKTVWFDARLDD